MFYSYGYYKTLIDNPVFEAQSTNRRAVYADLFKVLIKYFSKNKSDFKNFYLSKNKRVLQRRSLSVRKKYSRKSYSSHKVKGKATPHLTPLNNSE